ncbi:MAG: BatA domain-containing protein [Planctomycetota bacterium]
MTILNPSALYWALLAVPILILYAWRARPRRHAVATGFLWARVFSRARGRSTWWSLRRPLSLGVQLAVLALLILALAEPVASRPEMVAAGSLGLPLWPFPAAAALVLLAAEWHLFQRRWTC